jgi:hypothetical protein
MGAAFASPAGQAVIADSTNFLDMSRLSLLVMQEEESLLPGTAAAAPS